MESSAVLKPAPAELDVANIEIQALKEPIKKARERLMPPRWKRFGAIGCLALALTQNADTIHTLATMRGDGPMIPDIIGCPSPEYPSTEPTEAEVMVADVTSSAFATDGEAAQSSRVDRAVERFKHIREIGRQALSFKKYPQETYVSNHSGIEFTFYSDVAEAEWTINPEAFDEAFHFGLIGAREYVDEQIDSVVGCLRERIIDDQEFAGTGYSVYIPSNPDTCLNNGCIANLESRIGRTGPCPCGACQQRGGTLPTLRFRFGPLTFEENVMVLTGGMNADNRDERTTRLAVHEGLHAHVFLPGERNFRLDANEQWVKYQERMNIEAIDELEPFITWTE
jgi:hypothetical protein